jgi:hypothetical protein
VRSQFPVHRPGNCERMPWDGGVRGPGGGGRRARASRRRPGRAEAASETPGTGGFRGGPSLGTGGRHGDVSSPGGCCTSVRMRRRRCDRPGHRRVKCTGVGRPARKRHGGDVSLTPPSPVRAVPGVFVTGRPVPVTRPRRLSGETPQPRLSPHRPGPLVGGHSLPGPPTRGPDPFPVPRPPRRDGRIPCPSFHRLHGPLRARRGPVGGAAVVGGHGSETEHRCIDQPMLERSL